MAVSTDFPYTSQYVSVNGSKMHYIEQGSGDPILFIHGIPTWSYLWRNIIPCVSPQGRAIAVDLIGLGKSDKPDIQYSITDHIDYLTAFIEALSLKNITLVLHGWGSVVGLSYAARHADNIKAIACLESHLRPATSTDLVSLPLLEMGAILNTDDGGYDVIMNSNYFVNKIMPNGVLRELTDEEMTQYQAPFQQPGACKPLWQYLQELPLGNEDSPALPLITDYSKWLQSTNIPKLLLYAVPGFVTTIETVAWAKSHFSELTLIDLGDALHYAQESKPDQIGKALVDWYRSM